MLSKNGQLFWLLQELPQGQQLPLCEGQDMGSGQAQASGSNNVLKKNQFYSLHSRGENKTSLDVVTNMLNVFYINVYDLLYTGDTLSFGTPIVAKKFYILRNILSEHFMVST